ncbi:glycosyltransferase [Glaesserella parasuis]|uniref:glycosyltransferase n=1 Tax=Glaesserella parasuis TaxID=738 RepID=UPI003CFB8C5E
MKLSVLMAVYHKDKAEYFSKAIESISTKQTLKPDEIILVKDGKVPIDLEQEIDYWKSVLGTQLTVISLDKNVGTARALNEGLKYCSGTYIAKMDSDDISSPERFQSQVEYLNKNQSIDVVGTWISEIDENGSIIKDEVRFPLTHQELYKFFGFRDPLANPTAMFRRSFFNKVAKYSDDVHLAEDTLLWFEGFKKQCQFANMPIIGLKFRRSTKAFYFRRANMKKSIGLLKYRLFKINPELGYGMRENVYAVLYFLMALSPSCVKKFLYNNFR